jgi:hypothetical protein
MFEEMTPSRSTSSYCRGMKLLGLLVIAGIIFGLVYLQSSHEDGLSGVWNDVTNQEAPGINKIEQEFELDISP